VASKEVNKADSSVITSLVEAAATVVEEAVAEAMVVVEDVAMVEDEAEEDVDAAAVADKDPTSRTSTSSPRWATNTLLHCPS